VRAWIYDRTFPSLSTGWYRSVLERLTPGSRVLDVGVGTATALVGNAGLVRERNLRITGIDIDVDYLKKAEQRIRDANLRDLVDVKQESVYAHQGGPYDVAYFSASFMLLPDPAAALRHVSTLLAPDGRVFFTQTFHDKKNPAMERIKPLLVKLTTIHFGRVTYEEEFLAQVASADNTVVEHVVLERQPSRSYRLVVTQPTVEPGA
jgi:ubiquinone/menaquinone biosynthesis C-methylase UbiE